MVKEWPSHLSSDEGTSLGRLSRRVGDSRVMEGPSSRKRLTRVGKEYVASTKVTLWRNFLA